MLNLKFLFFFTTAVTSSYVVYGLVEDVPLPAIDLNEWWGPEAMRGYQDTSIRPFSVHFNESMVNDLRHRLRYYRPSAPPLDGVAFQYGFNAKELDKWLRYWAVEYPFSEREEFLNQFPQYKTNIQGLDIHFIWAKQKNIGNKEVMPLLLLHGWPGSVREFYEMIPHLTAVSKERDFVVEVIAPSLPGFGFSDAARRPGMGVDKMAVIFRNLMHRLGHKKYYIQGGDMGSIVTSYMATFFPDEILGYHTNLILTLTPKQMLMLMLGSIYPPMMMDEDVVDRVYPLSKTLSFTLEETGYLHQQATKPDTLGVGLSDSPAGLAAYILEKFIVGTRPAFRSRPDGGLTVYYSREQLIDNLMIYWVNNCITTSMRLYAETFNKRLTEMRVNEIKTPVPTWVIQAEFEITFVPPWMIRQKYPNLVNARNIPDAGHFLALEKPWIFADDVLAALAAFRKWWAH